MRITRRAMKRIVKKAAQQAPRKWDAQLVRQSEGGKVIEYIWKLPNGTCLVLAATLTSRWSTPGDAYGGTVYRGCALLAFTNKVSTTKVWLTRNSFSSYDRYYPNHGYSGGPYFVDTKCASSPGRPYEGSVVPTRSKRAARRQITEALNTRLARAEQSAQV